MTASLEALFFHMVGFEFLDKVMEMVTTPGNHSYMMLEAYIHNGNIPLLAVHNDIHGKQLMRDACLIPHSG